MKFMLKKKIVLKTKKPKKEKKKKMKRKEMNKGTCTAKKKSYWEIWDLTWEETLPH